MIKERNFYFNACMPVRGAAPGFATPLFSSVGENYEYVQVLDKDFNLEGLEPIDISPKTVVVRGIPTVSCGFNKNAYFAFVQEQTGILFGHRDELISILLANFDKYDDFPATQLTIARFAGHAVMAQKAGARLDRKIRDWPRTKQVSISLDKLPTTYIDLTAFRIIQDQFAEVSLFSSLQLKSMDIVRGMLKNDFPGLRIETPWKREIRRAFQQPSPYAGRFTNPGKAGIYLALSLESAVDALKSEIKRLLDNSNISRPSSQNYTVCQWRIQGCVADLRYFPVSARSSDIEKDLGAAIAASGIGGIIFHTGAISDAAALCVFNPEFVIDGIPTHRVELLFSNESIESRMSSIIPESKPASNSNLR